ncbi:MAG: phosphopyruvate hydratase [Candidatus Methanomethylicia archaeon]
MSSRISRVRGREILDSRGNPTVEAEVILESGDVGVASVPSGASTGKFEAFELRDGDKKRFNGRGVLIAVRNINNVISKALIGRDSLNQEEIDKVMIELDGTERKEKLGGNAILAVSLANIKAAAIYRRIPLYRYIEDREEYIIPVPLMNIINGGKHAGNKLSIQEFMIIPYGVENFMEALRLGVETYYKLKSILKDKYGSSAVNVGDEGGFTPQIDNTREALSLLVEAINASGYTEKEIALGIDAAASSFYDDENHKYRIDGLMLTGNELIDYYSMLINEFPIVSVEDPFHEEDYDSFKEFTEKFRNKIQIVGDDIFVTNKKRLEIGIEKGIANTLLFKVNQIGTVTEAFETMKIAIMNNYRVIVSHRSGETEDSYIADIAVGKSVGQIKTGAPCRGERIAKYNRLIRINEELEDKAKYIGRKLFNP